MPRPKKDYLKNPLDYTDIVIPLEIDHEPVDEWQEEVLDYWGNIAIRSGRQVGKSAIMAKKAAIASLKWSGIKILVTAASERQAAYIFEKIKHEYRLIKENPFVDVPTMRKMTLKNGSEIYCLPTGVRGDLIRGLTLDVWIPDEAAYIQSSVFVAVTPMLWVSKKKGKGWIWALSTPAGKEGKFYTFFENEMFKTWHISSEDCDRIPLDDLKQWKKEYTRVQYHQEVLGEFVDEISRLFTEEILDMFFVEEIPYTENWQKYLGVDVARYGGDQNAFVEARTSSKMTYITMCRTIVKVGLTVPYKMILELNTERKYRKILIDDAGVGGGLSDFLKSKLGNKIIDINNASRSLDKYDEGRRKKILKEDLYSNAIMMIEEGRTKALMNKELYLSLAGMQQTYEGGRVKIFGRESHLSEAAMRALWGVKTKGLRLFVHYS